ncbi:LIM domain only protein 7b isoform X3 [Girardinichthys multiradiatus]|uniref:LIM domain only protein 7b isoform X3 n=1 Tax=Girardinichthys multiradiatus TaxID=208333 RepID=UPI001FAC8520|nr:LIM domain only protein 7b isoform X3 [Girardinichthys multiradiatus]
MEWRQQSSVSCEDAFTEAQRWIEEVTGKSFGCSDFRAALENGVLLCDLINQLKPGIIKRVNRLSTPIAGLDNVNVFLKACGKLGLNESQLFHPGDLQDLSTRVTLRHDESQRRLKNVLITIYWLGRKAQLDTFYSGPQLNFKDFEGLLGLALSKALEEGSNAFMKDEGYKESHDSEGEESLQTRQSYDRGNSVDGFECVNPRAVRLNEEGFGSDAEAEQVYKMDSTKVSVHQRKGHIPPPLRRKLGREERAVGQTSQLPRVYQTQIRPGMPVQVNPGWIWSKSLSDIPMVYPVRKVSNGNAISDKGQDTSLPRDWNQGIEREYSVVAKDSEAHWQDDLTRWKNRRRSTKSELYRRSLEREHIVKQLTNGAVTNYEGNETPGGSLKRDQSLWRHSSSPRPYSVSSSTWLSCDLRPHTRVLLTHSNATEAPFSSESHSWESQLGPKPESGRSIMGEEPNLASDGRNGVTTPSLHQAFTSPTQVNALGSQCTFHSTSGQTRPQSVLPKQISPPVKLTQPEQFDTEEYARSYSSDLYMRSFNTDPKKKTFSPNAASQSEADVTENLTNLFQKSQETPRSHLDSAEDGGAGQQESAGVSKYLSRTTTWSSSASLPRGYRRSEGSTRLSSAITAKPFGAKSPRMSSLPRRYSDDGGHTLMLNTEDSQSLSTKPYLKRQNAAAHLRGQYQASVRQKKANQVRQNATRQREEVNCEPSTLIQPYTKRQSSHNESLALPCNASADLSKVDHSDMRVSLTLSPNSIPDFGFHIHWDATGVRIKFIQPGSPAEHCQLCVDDEVVAVNGVAVAHMTYSQWKAKMASSLQTGSLTMDIRRYGIKDWSTNKGSPHNRPGRSMLTLNLTSAAPVLIGRSDHHANNAASVETTDTQESQLNGQTDNVTQEKAIGGLFSGNNTNARRKGGSETAISDIEVPSLNPSSSSWSWDREEDRRRQEKWQEEQELLLQEQYQRDQERLQAEWQRAQQDAIEGEMPREDAVEMACGRQRFASSQLYVNELTKETKQKLKLDKEDQRDAEPKPPNIAHEAQNDRIPGKDWAEGSHGFAQLSHAHRAMSMSTPTLSGPYKQTRGDPRKRRGLTVSKAERERQQILEEMKKRTQLLTDNSWIRQRSDSFHKEPIDVGTSMKRYESLDNLDILHQYSDSAAAFIYPRPHSAAGLYSTQSRNASSRYSTGSMSLQTHMNSESSHYARMVSGRRTCCVCERVLGSGAAMVIDALSLCFHLTCFQCVGCHRHLGGTETGVQVRVRNRRPYCDYCHFQFNSTAFHV